MKNGNEISPAFEPRPGIRPHTVTISAPAKINLFLKVVGIRPDGYHDIFSWFQAVDLADQIEIEKTASPSIEIQTDHKDLPTGPENLIYKAIKLLRENLEIRSGFRISLAKRIPVAAGLGGGSSDAAAVIKGVNRLLNIGLTRSEMAALGLEIGSDVPFFFGRGQAEVTGRGEHVKDIQLATDYQVVLVTPPFGISAGEAYGKLNFDLTDSVQDISLSRCRQVDGLFDAISGMANDLERGLFGSYPVLDKIKDVLVRTGADVVRLSGSGPTVFALYRDRCQTKETLAQASDRGKWGLAVVSPVTLPG
ncbi:MAG: 4-(cytidine 5'-diphospho)-2-C-methyl-D-erythritol kinase [candidate division Zixibacteria bacterium]|nr:4-(cytidine 5'-diphospho)-2-C-methyl-D-erythritol kinase [candidate division Zixibacteria bacterium]